MAKLTLALNYTELDRYIDSIRVQMVRLMQYNELHKGLAVVIPDDPKIHTNIYNKCSIEHDGQKWIPYIIKGEKALNLLRFNKPDLTIMFYEYEDIDFDIPMYENAYYHKTVKEFDSKGNPVMTSTDKLLLELCEGQTSYSCVTGKKPDPTSSTGTQRHPTTTS